MYPYWVNNSPKYGCIHFLRNSIKSLYRQCSETDQESPSTSDLSGSTALELSKPLYISHIYLCTALWTVHQTRVNSLKNRHLYGGKYMCYIRYKCEVISPAKNVYTYWVNIGQNMAILWFLMNYINPLYRQCSETDQESFLTSDPSGSTAHGLSKPLCISHKYVYSDLNCPQTRVNSLRNRLLYGGKYIYLNNQNKH